MIIQQGIDLVECERIAKLMAGHGGRFMDRVFTEAERARAAEYRDPTQHIAGRWAAKEAILKMIGTGWRDEISWRDIEVLPDELGRPVVTLTGEAGRIARSLNITRVLLSITHTEHYAAASAIGTHD